MKVQSSACCVTLIVLFSEVLGFVSSASAPRTKITNSAECRNRYGYESYYDHGTEHCEQCQEICKNAEIMRTVEQCQAECPRYLTSMKCAEKVDQYYDEVLDTCSACSVLCDNHQVTGNSRACRELCNGYLEKLTPKQVPSLHKQNHLVAVDGSNSEKESQAMDSIHHPGWIVAIAVGGVAFVCMVVVVITLYWTCNQRRQQQQYEHAPGEDDEEQERQNRARRPVEETSQGTSGSQHFAIDVASALPTTVALADLPRPYGQRV